MPLRFNCACFLLILFLQFTSLPVNAEDWKTIECELLPPSGLDGDLWRAQWELYGHDEAAAKAFLNLAVNSPTPAEASFWLAKRAIINNDFITAKIEAVAAEDFFAAHPEKLKPVVDALLAKKQGKAVVQICEHGATHAPRESVYQFREGYERGLETLSIDRFCQRYATKFPSWHMPLKVYLDFNDPEKREWVKAQFSSAFDQWVKASDGSITYEWTHFKGDAQIVVSERTYRLAEDDIDTTTRRGGETFREANFCLKGYTERASITLVEFPNEKTPYSIFLHEIGHALGLEHIYTHDSIMRLTCPKDRTTISEYDKQLIHTLYHPSTSLPDPLEIRSLPNARLVWAPPPKIIELRATVKALSAVSQFPNRSSGKHSHQQNYQRRS